MVINNYFIVKVFSFSQKNWFVFFGSLLFFFMSFYSVAFTVFAQNTLNETINTPLEEFQKKTDFKDIEVGKAATKVEDLIGIILNFVLGITLTIFIVSVFAAGFIWMTSEGNEEKTKKAKTLLFQSSVGMAVVFFAYLIAYVLFSVFLFGTGFQAP